MVLNYPRRLSEEQELLINTVNELNNKFGEKYWSDIDIDHEYPEEFVKEFTKMGLFKVPVPEEYDGAGLGITDAPLILEEINAYGGNSQPFHGQYYMSWLISKFGTEDQKRRLFKDLGNGKIRMQSMGLTEPDAGSNTPKISTFAEKHGDKYIINGQKIFTSRIEQSDYILIVARTRKYENVTKKN